MLQYLQYITYNSLIKYMLRKKIKYKANSC